MIEHVKLVEVYNRSGNGTIRDYTVRSVYINPVHVVCLREDPGAERLLAEGKLPDDLDPRQEFTKVTLNKGATGQDITVVGRIHDIHEKLYGTNRTLLKG